MYMVMKIVKCSSEYWEFVRMLRNDERVSDGFIETINITPEMQKSYMSKYSEYYRIALINNIPAGYVGVIDNDIRICTHPDFQKMGVAKFMLSEIMKEYPDAYGKVKIENETSKNLFKSLDFQESFIIFTKNKNTL